MIWSFSSLHPFLEGEEKRLFFTFAWYAHIFHFYLFFKEKDRKGLEEKLKHSQGKFHAHSFFLFKQTVKISKIGSIKTANLLLACF